MSDKTSDKSSNTAQIEDGELDKVVGGCIPSGPGGGFSQIPTTTKPNPGPSGPNEGGGSGPSKPIVMPPGPVIF